MFLRRTIAVRTTVHSVWHSLSRKTISGVMAWARAGALLRKKKFHAQKNVSAPARTSSPINDDNQSYNNYWR